MRAIPIENTDLEISIEMYPAEMAKVTNERINLVRAKLKNLQSENQRSVLLHLAEMLVDIVENWNNVKFVDKLSKAIHCIQKANVFLAKQKEKFLIKSKKK